MPAQIAEEFRGGQGFGRAAADGCYGVKSEGAVTFQLRFAEPLVARRLVGKVGVRSGVMGDIGWFFAAERGLDVKQLAIGAGAVDCGIADGSERIVAGFAPSFFGETIWMSMGMPRSMRILLMALPRSSKT